MNKTSVILNEIKLVGITVRTNNNLEMNSSTAKIGTTIHQYFSNKLFENIPRRVSPGATYCVYTNYESDFTGDYTYFIGEQVEEINDSINPEFESLIIPMQHYVKFTTNKGKMPEICINAWQEIWSMNNKELGGERGYIADFELYDERSVDPQNTVLDIYIGVNNK